LQDFIPADVIDQATDFGCRERAPDPSTRYVAFADASSGLADSFAFAIASRGYTTPHTIHCVREYKPRFVPAQVIAELADICKAYRINEVIGDRYAIGFHEAEWQRHNIKYTPCERTTSENYLCWLPLLLANRVRLVDNQTLRHQLTSLERRVSTADKETVSHPQHASAHDDVAAAVCGAISQAATHGKYRYPAPGPGSMDWVSGGPAVDAEAQRAAEAQAFASARLSAHLLRGSFYGRRY
jgi:hypothetical protein